MKRKLIVVTMIVCGIILTACGGSPAANSESDTQMQTEIVQLLTSMVTVTATPLVQPTETPVPATATPEATKVPVVLVTPTPEATLEPSPAAEMPTLNITPSDGNFELITFTPEANSGSTKTTQKATDADAVSSTPEKIMDPAEGLGDPTYQDTFENGDQWSLGRDSYMDLRTSNGQLVMRGLSTTSGWRITRASLANGYIQLTGEFDDCSGADNYGLYFRVPNASTASSGYLYGISCDGKFALRKWNGETMSSLIYWKTSDAIKKGAGKTNKIGVMLDGYEMKLYINGELVGKTTDDDYGIGSIGLYVAAKESGDTTVLLNDLSVWKK
jgi:hypothetical protein